MKTAIDADGCLEIPPEIRDCLVLLEANFLSRAVATVALPGETYLQLPRQAPSQPIAGGQFYDAIIVACALAAKVDAVLTFNERRFLPLAPPGLQVVVPP